MPGDPGYGFPFLGIHLYAWAYITHAIVIADVIAIIVEEGFAWRLPCDPEHWNLIEQLRGH
jgi:hypothetical protein